MKSFNKYFSKSKLLSLLSNIVRSIFMIGLLWWPNLALAIPSITTVTLNGQGSATFNPQAGESLNFNLVVSEPAKFSTIAICSVEVSDCTRTSAVKYFTQTSKYDTTVEKIWDGKKGGSNPDYVPVGNYRLVVTLAGQGDESDKAEIDLSNNIITVSNVANSNSRGGNDNSNSTTTDSTIIATSTNNTPALISAPSDYSPYSSYGTITTYVPSIKLAIGGGRARLGLVGVPIDFKVEANEVGQAATYRFSFGDGTSGEGRRLSHAYSFPGTYEVVITGQTQGEEVVTTTKVKVVEPTLALVKFNPINHEVVLRNYGTSVMNIGKFRLIGAGHSQELAADTIIEPGQVVSIYINDQLIGASTLRLESPGAIEVATINRSMLINNRNLNSKVDESDLAEEEKNLAQLWEAQLATVRDSKKLMIVGSMTASGNQAELTRVTTTAQVVLPRKESVPPRVEPKELVGVVNFSTGSSSVIYQGSTSRSWWQQMIKLVSGIFNS